MVQIDPRSSWVAGQIQRRATGPRGPEGSFSRPASREARARPAPRRRTGHRDKPVRDRPPAPAAIRATAIVTATSSRKLSSPSPSRFCTFQYRGMARSTCGCAHWATPPARLMRPAEPRRSGTSRPACSARHGGRSPRSDVVGNSCMRAGTVAIGIGTGTGNRAVGELGRSRTAERKGAGRDAVLQPSASCGGVICFIGRSGSELLKWLFWARFAHRRHRVFEEGFGTELPFGFVGDQLGRSSAALRRRRRTDGRRP